MSFGFGSTTQDVLDGVDLSGKLAIITGCSSGIGLETARSLAKAGAKVVMANRKSKKSDDALAQLQAELPQADISQMELDLGSLKSVRSFTDECLQKFDTIDLLINNAGVMACPQGTTEDGFETQFGTNHLGHFVLTCRLVHLLAAADSSRIVNLSSGGHRRGSVDLADPNYKNRPYEKWEAYGQSKTANILFSLELNRRLASRGVLSFSVHPGVIMTDLSRHLTEDDMEMFAKRDAALKESGATGLVRKPVEAGAATTVWAATAPELSEHGGAYLEDCGLSRPVEGEADVSGYAPWAVDADLAEDLWALSEELVGEEFDL